MLVGIAGVLLVLAVAGVFFVRYQLTKSFPPASGSVALGGLEEEVRVVRDAYGVPRILARNEHDALFTLGVVHAQDRLWQMDLQRRAAQGRLSEVFGSVTVPYDRMFRIVGLHRTAVKIEQQLTEDTRRRLQWYSDGVNAWRTHSAGVYPIEFDLLRYDPEPWTPVDCILVSRLLAWELNLSWWTDLTYGALTERLGSDMVSDILPAYPQDVAPTLSSAAWRGGLSAGVAFLHTAREYREFMGRPLPVGGSNAWAIGPGKSATGKAILANDTHLHLSAPSQWYEVQYRMPGLTACGMSIPGVPGIVTGRNDSIAWGVTNLMADEADFCIEEVRDADSSYRYRDRWVPLTVIEEDIPVRDSTPVNLRVRLTHNGPIVTDIHTPLNRARPTYVASMHWTGAEPDDQIGTFLAMNRATDWRSFRAALKEYTVPGQNFVFADVRGNIGYACAARIPVRRRGRGLLPLPGWDDPSPWSGYVPFESLPQVFNPAGGYVASANEKIIGDSFPYVIGDLWEPPSRIQRLRDVLGTSGAQFTVRDCEILQNGTYSQFARDVSPFLTAACTDSVIGTVYGERVREYLRNWTFRFTREDIATTIFQFFLLRLMENIYRDEMGDDLYHDFTTLVNVPLRVTTRLLEGGDSRWFDDIRTPEIESREEIIRRSIRQAIAELRARLGDDPRTWRWGGIHTVTLQHPFGLQKPLDKIFNIGPFEYPGGSTTMMSGEYSLTDPFRVTVGASYRQIFDFSRPGEYRAVLPTGESGQVFHRHYDDQTPLWLNGGYRTVSTLTEGSEMTTLLLMPVRR